MLRRRRHNNQAAQAWLLPPLPGCSHPAVRALWADAVTRAAAACRSRLLPWLCSDHAALSVADALQTALPPMRSLGGFTLYYKLC